MKQATYEVVQDFDHQEYVHYILSHLLILNNLARAEQKNKAEKHMTERRIQREASTSCDISW